MVVDGVGADLTTTLHFSFLPPIFAVMVAFPFFFATTVPVEFTVATLLFELDHFTFEALTCSLLSIGICAGLSSLLPAITPQSCVGIGSLIGYLGTDVLKRFFISFISSRTGVNPDFKDSDK